MSFLKRIFGGSVPEKQVQPQTSQVSSAPLTDEAKQLLFNGYGSQAYDDMVWLGQHYPERSQPIYGGLKYLIQAIEQLQPVVPEAATLVHKYTAPSVHQLRQAIMSNPDVATRFFINCVEFQARIEHAVGTLASTSTEDADSYREWLKQEEDKNRMRTSTASFFNAPLAWSLARDNEWMQVDADSSPKTRMLLWGTLCTANLFAGHMLNHFKQRFALPRAETQEAVFAHMRAAWMGYVTHLLEDEQSTTVRAVSQYMVMLVGDARLLSVYGLHVMNAVRNQLYRNNTQHENFEHFALILRPYAPQVENLDEAQAEDFFKSSRFLSFTAAETQWIHKILESDLTEAHVASLNQNLNQQVMAMMRHPLRREFKGFQG